MLHVVDKTEFDQWLGDRDTTGTVIVLANLAIDVEIPQAAVVLPNVLEFRAYHLAESNPQMGTDSALQRMKEALEQCLQPQIDYARLRIAARIVQQHTHKAGQRFVTGWPAQRQMHTEAQIAKLGTSLSSRSQSMPAHAEGAK